MDPLVLDASHGEGGGQVLRTALALAVALGRPVTLEGIRLRRPRPGLQPQHLTVVRALAAIADADVAGDALGSTALAFTPHGLRAGEWRFDIGAIKGSAGSVSLLLQSLLLPLARAYVPKRRPVISETTTYLPACFTIMTTASAVKTCSRSSRARSARAWRSTASATLPRSARFTELRVPVVTTIVSAPKVSASVRISVARVTEA